MVPLTALERQITSARFDLRLVTHHEASGGARDPSWHEDYPRREDRDAFSMVRDETSAEGSWGPRHVVRRIDGLVIGSIGFFGPPQPGLEGMPEVEVGFGLVPYARGRGVVTECLGALLGATDRVGVCVRAATAPENTAALRVLAATGFTRLRGSDEDGHLVLARPVTA